MINISTFPRDPLQDSEFLKQLDAQPNRETYARLAALTWDEEPIEYIEGKITGGTINIDGSSAIRRTISLNMIAYNINIDNFSQGLNTKVRIEIGMRNDINPDYPDIIWFKQGTFVLTSFNTSINTNSYSISLQGKDKMCLLNGDVGGNLPASVDFGVEEYVSADGTITYHHIPIKDIIKNAVHVYGNEPLHNIIISDLDLCGYELLEYRGSTDTPLYLFRDTNTGIYINMSPNGNQTCYVVQPDGSREQSTIGNLGDAGYLNQVNAVKVADTVKKITLSDDDSVKQYQVCKIQYGDVAGYRRTELTYAGDLISGVGESLTSILDKIKQMLGNYEYFYDLDGRFIFQKQKNNLYQNWNPIQTDENGRLYVDDSQSPLAYSFTDSNTITAMSHTPTLTNLKNDFSIWGVRKGVSGADIPIHMRYALDKKPIAYTSIAVSQTDSEHFIHKLKWPFEFNAEDKKEHESEEDAIERQKQEKYAQESICYVNPQKDTEQYQPEDTPVQSHDWRELIYRMARDYYLYGQLDDFDKRVAAANPQLYPTGKTGYELYYIDIQGFWRQLYNPEEGASKEDYYQSTDDNKPLYWNKNVDTNPALLNFWFDFLGEGTIMDKYMAPAIGHRTKVVNDSKITSIYFKEVPSVLFVTDQEMMELLQNKTAYADKANYTYIRINEDLKNLFSISTQGLSAQDKLEELLATHTYCTEAMNITALPIYYLQPNSRISLYDAEYNITGEYLISKITLPLAYNGTMQLTAVKAAENI